MSNISLPIFSKDEQMKLIFLSKLLRNSAEARTLAAESYTKEFLTAFNIAQTTPVAASENAEEVDIVAQIETMLGEIQQLKADMGRMDPTERVAIMKNQMGLFEKWVSLKERTQNLKEMSEFQQIVIAFMDEILTPDQQTKFVSRLRSAK